MKITKQKQTLRWREQTSGYQWGGKKGKIGYGIKYELVCGYKINSHRAILYNIGNIAIIV